MSMLSVQGRPAPKVHREVKRMTNYELMFIIDPTIEDAKKDAED